MLWSEVVLWVTYRSCAGMLERELWARMVRCVRGGWFGLVWRMVRVLRVSKIGF
jgi:hypothetical protein